MADCNWHTLEKEATYKWMFDGITLLFNLLTHMIFTTHPPPPPHPTKVKRNTVIRTQILLDETSTEAAFQI